MIHCGIDTVSLNGEGFAPLVKEGEHVQAHTPILRFDRTKIKDAGYSDQTMVTVTNSDAYDIEIYEGEADDLETPILTMRKK